MINDDLRDLLLILSVSETIFWLCILFLIFLHAIILLCTVIEVWNFRVTKSSHETELRKMKSHFKLLA